MPTVRELAAQGLATALPSGHYAISAEGHALMGDVMRRNGERSRAWRNT